MIDNHTFEFPVKLKSPACFRTLQDKGHINDLFYEYLIKLKPLILD